MKALWLFWNPPAAFWQWCTTAASQGRFGEIDIFLLFCFVSLKLWCFFFFFNCFTTIELWRICVLCSHLRYDTLAQMLTLANVHARSKVLVFETCAGLVLGSVMERMGGVEKATLSTFLSVWPAAAFFLFLPHQHFFLYNCPPFLPAQATAQWSKCTPERSPYEPAWRALASLHIFTTRCMSSPSAASMLCWQEPWTQLQKH